MNFLAPHSLVLYTLFILNLPLIAQREITGAWLTEKDEALIQITETDGIFSGTIVWLRQPLDKSGQPKKDRHNSSPELRARYLLGIPVIYKMRYNPGKKQWDGGKVYIPRFGKEIDAIISLENKNILKLKGFTGGGKVSHTQVWQRKA